MGLILPEVDHKAANKNQVFNQAYGALKAYDPSIQDNDKKAVSLNQEKNWSGKIDRQAVIRNAERVGKKFVLSCVEETWLVRLNSEITLFNHVTLRDILDHLRPTSTGGEAIDVIGI